MKIKIREIRPEDLMWVEEVVRGWGAEFVVTRGRKVYPARLPGFLAIGGDGKRVGVISYEIRNKQCEIVIFEVFKPHGGIGTRLLKKTAGTAVKAGCKRLWLITTNDNLEAMRFYQRRGFVFAGIHVNAIEKSRKIKSSIPKTGNYGIPIRDEMELEMFPAKPGA